MYYFLGFESQRVLSCYINFALREGASFEKYLEPHFRQRGAQRAPIPGARQNKFANEPVRNAAKNLRIDVTRLSSTLPQASAAVNRCAQLASRIFPCSPGRVIARTTQAECTYQQTWSPAYDPDCPRELLQTWMSTPSDSVAVANVSVLGARVVVEHPAG